MMNINDSLCCTTVPVQSTHLLSRDSAGTHIQSYIENERVEFQDGEIRQIICRVNGSYPAPQVRIFVDDHDITEHFSQTTDVVTVGPAATKGLQVIRVLLLLDDHCDVNRQ